MIIERNFSKFVVFSEDTLLSALNKINDNQCRAIFAVSESGILEGVLTDGDLRRWLTSTSEINLNVPVSRVINRNCKCAGINDSPEIMASMLTSKILAIPLLDTSGRLVGVALPSKNRCEIEGRVIDEESRAFLIAEIGNNHNGDFQLAKELIDAAAAAGADCAKFQMRDLNSLYRNRGNSNDATSDLSAQYTLDLLNRYQLPDDDLFRAFDYCRGKGLVPLCTPWDHASLLKLQHYGLGAYKIASADFTNYDLIGAVAAAGKPIICSTGMSTETEIREGVKRILSYGIPFVLLHCNSTYPAPFKDINLHYISHLKKLSGALVGYSGHERDVNIAIAAVSLGAKVVEKHFTLDKSMEGNDHKVSLLPEEFARMVSGIRQVEEGLGAAEERRLSQGEMMNRENLAKSLVAAVDIPAGTVVTEQMIQVQSPGQGLQPNRKMDLLGRPLTKSKKSGEYFYPSDLEEGSAEARHYTFRRPWGIPVRYHDMQRLLGMSNIDLLEIHLSYKDMELDFRDYISEPLDLGLVVHAPELFSRDHILDLCSIDEAYRQQSITEMQRVIDLTRELTPYFNRTERPCIVTNVGGFSHSGHMPEALREERYERLESSLALLDTSGVEITPQTMPPFPWHFGGQQFHNIFVDAEGIVRFCRKNTMRVCLDVSHSMLACTHLKQSFWTFLKRVGPYAAHLHIADATGVDGEGLQIGQGDIDWKHFFEAADKYAAQASFIPEIWQGHKNDSEGAWLALDRLETASSAVETGSEPHPGAAGAERQHNLVR